MKFFFNEYTENTEALITSIVSKDDNLGLYELTALGVAGDKECSYTNEGVITIFDDELKEILDVKDLVFPNGIVGQKVRIVSNAEFNIEKTTGRFNTKDISINEGESFEFSLDETDDDIKSCYDTAEADENKALT